MNQIAGVSLEQFAAVNAALADAFRLRDVLAIEEIERAAWERADPAWTARVAADGARRGPLFQRYEGEFAAAEDWLTRPVAPLDAELDAWVAFQAAIGACASPAELLRSVGMRTADVSRLARRWERMFAADSSLGARAAKLAERGVVALPAIVVSPVALRRSRGGASRAPAAILAPAPAAVGSRAARLSDAAATGSSDALAGESLTLESYVALCADLAMRPDDSVRIFERHGVATAAAREALERHWQGRFAREPLLERDFRALYGHRRARLERAQALPAAHPSAVPAASSPLALPLAPRWQPAPDGGNTGEVSALLRGRPALPFVEDDTPPSTVFRRAAAYAERLQGPLSTQHPAAGATVESLTLLVAPPASPPSPSGPPSSSSPPSPSGPTSSSSPASSSSPPSSSSPSSSSRPASSSTPAAASPTTLDIDEALAGVALPFSAGARPAPARAELEPHPAAGETFEVGEVLAAAALPFASKPAPQKKGDPTELSLEQYASLVVDLALAPAARKSTLALYHLSEARKAALDDLWARRFTADPALGAAYAKACAAYRAWLRGHPR